MNKLLCLLMIVISFSGCSPPKISETSYKYDDEFYNYINELVSKHVRRELPDAIEDLESHKAMCLKCSKILNINFTYDYDNNNCFTYKNDIKIVVKNCD